MIHFIDQTSVGNHHMVFNASMVKILLRIYPREQIVLHGIQSNHQAMQEFFSDEEKSKISYKPIAYSEAKKNTLFFKAINFYKKEQYRKQLFKTLYQSSTEKDLIFLSITSFLCFRYFKKVQKKYKIPSIACLHGDIDFLYNVKSAYEKYNAFIHRQILANKAEHFKFLLLNKIALQYLIKDGYLNANEALEIDHPFTALNLKNEKIALTQKPIIVAHIGSMEVERKNSHLIYALGEKCKDLVLKGDVAFQTIGLITSPIIPYKNNFVIEIVGNEEADKPKYLSRAQYETALSKVHYTIFFLPVLEYVFRASGAIVDTVTFEKPIITLKHPYFEYLFEVAGNVGYMVDTLDEMKDLLNNIANEPSRFEAEYLIQCDNLKTFKEKLTVENISIDLSIQLADFRK